MIHELEYMKALRRSDKMGPIIKDRGEIKIQEKNK